MKCCEQELSTPFCPHCGNRAESPLLTLVAHVQKGRNVYAKDVERVATAVNTYPNNPHYKKRLASKKKILSKWDSWLNALQTIINNQR
jgi:hypothetical protein